MDNSIGYKILSFMDVYFGYIQIPMHDNDMNKTTFMIENANYMYNVSPFGLKNEGATCQRMTKKKFEQEISDMLKVNMDDVKVEKAVHRDLIF